jgi:hypothetical protein
MHHEDRASVNAFIRGIDRLGNGRLPAAVKRRAADILTFQRPDNE